MFNFKKYNDDLILIEVKEMSKLTSRINELEKQVKDFKSREVKVLNYLEPYLELMWAAEIASILLGCDFRDSKTALNNYLNKVEK